jgi:hypothetical protein
MYIIIVQDLAKINRLKGVGESRRMEEISPLDDFQGIWTVNRSEDTRSKTIILLSTKAENLKGKSV